MYWTQSSQIECSHNKESGSIGNYIKTTNVWHLSICSVLLDWKQSLYFVIIISSYTNPDILRKLSTRPDIWYIYHESILAGRGCLGHWLFKRSLTHVFVFGIHQGELMYPMSLQYLSNLPTHLMASIEITMRYAYNWFDELICSWKTWGNNGIIQHMSNNHDSQNQFPLPSSNSYQFIFSIKLNLLTDL